MSPAACVSTSSSTPSQSPSRRQSLRRSPNATARHVGRVVAGVVSGVIASGLTSGAAAQSYTYHELATIPGFPITSASGVNNLGEVVGWIQDPASSSRLAVIWDAYLPNQAPMSLGIPPHSWTVPDVGAVAIFPSHYTPSWFQDQGQAFFWESSSGYTTLSAGAHSGEAVEINNCEQIIGVVRLSAQGPPQTILWERAPDGTFLSTPLPGLSNDPAHHTYPTGINDAGQAIGRAQVGTNQFAPVVWDLVNGTVIDLRQFMPAPTPGTYFTATNVNGIGNDGTIVGRLQRQITQGGPVTSTAFVLLPTTSPTILCPGSVCLPPPPPFDLLPPQTVYQDAVRHRVTFTVTGATPGQTVFIVDDSGSRYSQMIAGQCPIGIPPASLIVDFAVVDPNGVATVTVTFPNTISGTVREYVAVEPGTCVLDAETFTHP